jgi:Gpi18-like mannosyltransferase
MAVFSWLFPIPDCSDFPCSENTQQVLFQQNTYSRLFLSPWYRWDSVHYLDIAENGYQREATENSVWPPIFPFLIRSLSGIMPPMQAALFLSTLFAFLAFYLLHVSTSQQWDKVLADRLLFLTAIFPGSFFFMAAYTESLFLFMALGSILSARRREWFLAGICGALAALTRQQGVLLILPILWEIYEAYFKETDFEIIKVLKPGLFAGLVPLAALFNFSIIHFVKDMPWPWETIFNTWSHRIVFPWTGIIQNFLSLTNNKISLWHISIVVDLFLSILFIYLLLKKVPDMPFSYRIFGVTYLLPGLIFLKDSGRLISISRYILPVFPAFISLALLLKKKNFKLTWAALSFSIQILLLFCFYKWIWVA